MGEECEERLAVRLLVQRPAAERLHIRDAFDVGREVVEALGAQEEPLGHFRQPRQFQRLRQRRTVCEHGPVMVAVPALGVEPAALRHRFEQRGLPAAVLADEERHAAPKLQVDSF
jgi:hypothetical protein